MFQVGMGRGFWIKSAKGAVLAATWLTVSSCADLFPEKHLPGGVESYERITLGGISQAIQIRGERPDSPVLLFLHGGPGISEMPVSRTYGGLEKDFIIVHWDQRGTGLSYDPSIPLEAMKLENFVNDTLELTHQLQQRFHRRKIYLAGFSFGSEIGILAVKREPQNYQAFISISQCLDVERSEQILAEETRRTASKLGDFKTLRGLEKLGPPPYKDTIVEGRVTDLRYNLLRARTPWHMTTARYLSLVPGSRAYHFRDYLPVAKGRTFAFDAVQAEVLHLNIMPRVMKLEVPVYFLLGRWDTVLSTTLVQQYERKLQAPRKEIHWFEHSGHAPHLEEPTEFMAVMRQVKRETQR